MIYPSPVFVDSSSLRNFATIGRIDILFAHFGDRLHWVEAVEAEIHLGRYDDDSEKQAILDHKFRLGEPVRFVEGRRQIEILRRALGGTRRTGEQRKNLGEAQCIFAIEFLHDGRGTFLSDDRNALAMARNRKINCIDTFDVIKNCFDEGLLTCPEPYDLLVEMSNSRRGVRLPAAHTDICP
jgi:predicted nucleic acid-binding protein